MKKVAQMKSSKGLLLALFVLLAALLLLSTTRLGVFLIFDLVGGSTDNLDVEPDNSPLLLSRKLSAESTYDLPTVVEQASGIVFSEDTIYVSTDQGELFTFNLSFDLKDQKANLLSGLLILKQGRLEAITVAERRVLGIGEIGAIGVWEKGDGVWRRQQNIALPLSLADEEFTGICINSKGIWATVSETSNLINLGDGSYSTIDFRQLTKLDADLSALMISGIDCDDDYFYLITENYTSIIILDETYTAVEVIGIDAGEASDIAVHDRYAYVTVDHNYFDARPPVYRYRILE